MNFDHIAAELAKDWVAVDGSPSLLSEALRVALEQAYEEGLEDGAQVADRLYLGFHSPYEYHDDVAAQIRALVKQPPANDCSNCMDCPGAQK